MKTRNFSDWAVALVVVGCSAGLFLALAFALTGKMLSKPGQTIYVNFRDVTGVNLGAQVKYAGALAGKVAKIRMLTAAERKASADPLNAVQVTLALNAEVPPLPSDVKPSVGADTLLSEKLIILNGGSPEAPTLKEGAVLQGIPPTTFDKLVRNADGVIEDLRGALGDDKTGDLFARLNKALDETEALLAQAKPLLAEAKPLIEDARTVAADAKPLVADARSAAADAKQLLADNKAAITTAIGNVNHASAQLDQMATRGNKFLAANDSKLSAAIADFSVTSQNFKVTSTYAKILIRNLTLRPSLLVWANSKPMPIPSEQEILKSSRPIPLSSN